MTNKRIRYTKMFLKESLIKFLKEKPLSRITVTELCKDANINRSTYYSHYTDPYDQFEQIETEFINSLKDYMTFNQIDSRKNTLLEIGSIIARFFYDNSELYLVLNGNERRAYFENKLIDMLKEISIRNLKYQNIHYSEMAATFSITYAMSGSNMVIYEWLSKKKEEYTPEQIAVYLYRISMNGLNDATL